MGSRIERYDGPVGTDGHRLAQRRIAIAQDRAGLPYLIRADSVVVELGDGDVGAARAHASERGLEVLGDPTPEGPSGVIGVRIHPSQRPALPERWTTDTVNRLLDDLGSADYAVRPNHVYTPDGLAGLVGHEVAARDAVDIDGLARLRTSALPASEPPAWREPTPGARVPHVLILDTGLRTSQRRPEHPRLSTCRVHEPWLDRAATRFNDEDEPDDDGGGWLDRQAGHGTFISGIVRRICPEAVIHHAGVLSSYGDGDDASVAAAIDRTIARSARTGDHIDVVVASFGAYGDEPPPMAAALARLMDHAVVVAAAGNDATAREFYPAALPDVVAVGALGAAGRAPFSNHGPWVDACALGTDVVSTFFSDAVDGEGDGSRSFHGWASWSGTSFAAPVVAAEIARGIARTGDGAPAVWRRLVGDQRRLRLPGLGLVIDRS